MSFREVKRRARRQLHARLAEPALYFAGPDATPVPVTVRLHLKFADVGGPAPGYAEMSVVAPRVVFLAEQVAPSNRGIVVTRDLGAWRVESHEPADDVTITAEVARLSDAQATQFGWALGVDYMGHQAPEI